ncbi:MAG TPA: CHAT domain-containing protein [Ktedonobacteraceae bacterium]|jgi:hypothetical protein
MNDFTLAITSHPSGLLLTASGEKQVRLELAPPGGLTGAQAGRRLYQQIFSGPVLAQYQACAPDRVLVYGPEEVLDWPWQDLHDGVWPLALRHPLVLLPGACAQAPAPGVTLEGGPLRMLLTLQPDAAHAALAEAIERWIDLLEQRYPGRVLLRKVRVPAKGYRQVQQIFQQTLTPFHFWQHVGPCSAELALRLGEEMVQLRHLNTLLAEQRAGCCVALATCGQAPPASLLSQLRAPFVLCQVVRPGNADPGMLRGFYERLPTHDLAVAATLGQLEACLEESEQPGPGHLILLARTTQLALGMPRPLPRPWIKRAHQQRRARVLVLKANPQGAVPGQVGLRIEQEINQIKAVLRENRDVVELHEVGAVRMQDLELHLQRQRPALLHFSGHGTQGGKLVLERYASLEELWAGTRLPTAANADAIAYAVIVGILARYSATLRCVVLNACATEPLAQALCAYIPCAIGMRGPLNDVLAIRFAEILYQALTAGESVGQAFRMARSDVLSHPKAQAETFQLKSCRGVEADEVYLVPEREVRL